MLRTVVFKQGQEDTMRLVLSGWAMTEHTMAALSNLPQWTWHLHFASGQGPECTWPLPPHAYEQLAACVPRSYARWHVKAPIDSHLLKSICVCVERARQGLPSLEISVWGYEGENVQVGQHVVLKAGPPLRFLE